MADMDNQINQTVERIGQLPDCGSSDHDTDNRCFNYISPEDLESGESEEGKQNGDA